MVGSRTGMIRLLVVILTSLEGVFNFSTASETGVVRSLGTGGPPVAAAWEVWEGS